MHQYSIVDYGMSSLGIAEPTHRKIQQFESKCIRSMAEEGITYGENLNNWGQERETNENIRRAPRITTTESEIYGGKLCNIHRRYTTKAGPTLNNINEYNAEINYMRADCTRIQQAIKEKHRGST